MTLSTCLPLSRHILPLGSLRSGDGNANTPKLLSTFQHTLHILTPMVLILKPITLDLLSFPYRKPHICLEGSFFPFPLGQQQLVHVLEIQFVLDSSFPYTPTPLMQLCI